MSNGSCLRSPNIRADDPAAQRARNLQYQQDKNQTICPICGLPPNFPQTPEGDYWHYCIDGQPWVGKIAAWNNRCKSLHFRTKMQFEVQEFQSYRCSCCRFVVSPYLDTQEPNKPTKWMIVETNGWNRNTACVFHGFDTHTDALKHIQDELKHRCEEE